MTDDAIRGLLRQVEAKDLSTAAHTWRVVLYTRALAEAGGAPHGRIDLFCRAAALHDIGKLDTPAEILQKPGRLTPEETRVMQRHADAGDRLLRSMGETDQLVLGLVRHHHERLDGSGYPDGLAGDAIPLAARYFAVIDSFDAMTSVRPYRATVGHDAAERALEELWSHADKWYCSIALLLFEKVFRSGSIEWILSYWNDARLLPDYAHGVSQAGAASAWPNVEVKAGASLRSPAP